MNNKEMMEISTQDDNPRASRRLPRLAFYVESYEVKLPTKKKTKKRILDDIKGFCHGSEMKMILGPSGSGKTSLLGICAGHLGRGDWKGKLYDDGVEAGRFSRRACGMVEQHSLFFWNLTARETLKYQAMLRQPDDSTESITKKVNSVLADLDLLQAADTYCGDERHKGLSGGELRRLSIAQELLADPSTLLADEPTSGLDAATALLTIATLSRVCRRGDKALVAVIHQPRPSILQLFDSLLVLSGGRVAYQGLPGQPLEAYLSGLGLSLPQYENPGDFLLDLIAVSDDVLEDSHNDHDDANLSRSESASVIRTAQALLDERRHNRDLIVQAYVQSPGLMEAVEMINVCEEASKDRNSSTQNIKIKKASWFFQFRVLLSRALRYKIRDDEVALTQISMSIIFSVIIGAVFFNLNKNVESVTNRIGAISFSVLLMAFLAFDVVILFPKERDLYRREKRAGLHCASSFFHARCCAELPSHLIAGAIYAIISYYMMGFQNDTRKFLLYISMMELELFTGTSVLIACGCLARDFAGANNLATIFICIFLMFDGHYINNKEIPSGARFVKDLNYLNYGISALSLNEFRGIGSFRCSDNDEDSCPFVNGGEVVDFYGFDKNSMATNFWALALIALAWRTIAFFAFQNLYVD